MSLEKSGLFSFGAIAENSKLTPTTLGIILVPVKNENYHRLNLKDSILDASIERIAAKGIDSFSLREVSALLRVSHNAAYRHYPNKRALLAACRKKVEEEFTSVLSKSIEGLDLRDVKTMAKLGEAYIMFFTEHPAYFRFIYESDSTPIDITLDPQAPNYPPFKIFQSCCLALIDEYRCGEKEGLERLLKSFALVQGLSSLAVSPNVALPKDFTAMIGSIFLR